MLRQTATVAEVIDKLTYINYKHNRWRGVISKDFCLIWSEMMVARMEKQYQEEFANA